MSGWLSDARATIEFHKYGTPVFFSLDIISLLILEYSCPKRRTSGLSVAITSASDDLMVFKFCFLLHFQESYNILYEFSVQDAATTAFTNHFATGTFVVRHSCFI